ncbi:DUF433 domain-containing protein [Halobaculum roseum]|uniref:DUF433 domain-containing protein n=1 Tax=Halobaculum roseum TaxID=2175149 RepID=A0ABD5MQK3_9EURY|nr:DUF433 domain-containing protein [Halobaculum roseum]QZY03577.1 DUF433 domain-containing protein [Halobaculum roseum]
MSETTSSNGGDAPRIVRTEDVLGGDPRIDGTRISVLFVYERVEGRGLEPRAVADRHDLDVADVYRALAYYHEHPSEVAAIREEREQNLDAARSDPAVATGPEDAPETTE